MSFSCLDFYANQELRILFKYENIEMKHVITKNKYTITLNKTYEQRIKNANAK